MPQCVVIADDLTGANATGVLLKKMNYKAYTVMNTSNCLLCRTVTVYYTRQTAEE